MNDEQPLPTTRHPDELVNELFDICQDFFTHASPETLHELDTALHARGNHGGHGWLIDMLQLEHHRRTTTLNN